MSLQQPPLGQKKVAAVERLKTRVNVWIFCLPGQKKVAVVEKWPLVEVRL